MLSRMIVSTLLACTSLFSAAAAKTTTTTALVKTSSTASTTSSAVSPSVSTSLSSTRTPSSSSSAADPSAPPDVYLNVPQLSVGRIELDVDNLQADINLAAKVASLVSINAGVQLSVQNINLTISDIDVQLELIVRLGHLVDIVNRVFDSVDLNPLLVSLANTTTSLLGDVVGAVDSLLGSVTQGGKTLNFIVDNLGNIVQQVEGTAGDLTSSIVGNYLSNMTFTGQTSNVGNGLTQKVYSYAPLNALVDIVTNTAGQVVQATVDKGSSGNSGAISSSAAPAPTGGARK